MTAPKVTSVTVNSATSVTLGFDQAMAVDAVFLDPLSYAVDGGLFVTAAANHAATPGLAVDLTTSPQRGGRAYVLTASAALRSASAEYLDPTHSTRTFTGTAAAEDYTVTELVAKTHPDGITIELFWTNPAPDPTNCTIVRRLRSGIFDETDPGDTVYDGAMLASATPSDPKFVDTGLLEGEFYYYVVLVKAAPGDTYAITPAARVTGFAGWAHATLDSKGWWTQNVVPGRWVERDDGILDDVLTGLGGATDLLRSIAKGYGRLGDDEKAPDAFVRIKSRGEGFEPEGDAYDLDTPRRVFLQLAELRKRRGSIRGIVQAAYALVLWDVLPIEFGVGTRARTLTTVDPGEPADPLTYTFNASATASAAGSLTDATKAWAPSAWQSGRVLDGLGNWLDVADNSPTVLTIATPPAAGPWRTTLAANVALSATSATLGSVAGLLVGQRIQILDTANGNVHVAEITAIDPATKIVTFWNPAVAAVVAVTGVVTWDVTAPQAKMAGTLAGGGPSGVLAPVLAAGVLRWQTDQWVGFKVRDAGGTVRTVTASDATTMTVAPAAVLPAGTFTVARDFSGATPVLWYRVVNGDHQFLWDPSFDLELRGTRLDPFSYTYGGLGSLGGAFGPADLGLFVTTPGAALLVGRVSGVSGATILDASVALVPGSLRGTFVNPNQNQTRLFPVLDNDVSSIVVGADVSQIAQVGQAYVVFTPRNATRYRRLLKRLPEFMADDVTPRILFL